MAPDSRTSDPKPDRRPSDREIVESLGNIGRAFFGGFSELREIQRLAIPLILQRRSLLVASATASGKTEAVMAPMIAHVASADRQSREIRVLVVAPTRALVNDLFRRIESPLDRLGLACGCQTSDRRDKAKKPFVLVTTPESFDSMLVRDGVWRRGRLKDHLLAYVEAVQIDEAHLFDGNARGDQLPWLLGRLRRLRQFQATSQSTSRRGLQVCAASATVANPDQLANRLLGRDACFVRAPGIRKIEIFGRSPNPAWLELGPSLEIDAIRRSLETVPAKSFPGIAGRRLSSALAAGADAMRKILVFVPTRQLADTLSTHWASLLAQKRELRVLAHHGSLSKARRESAERSFLAARDAVLVATTTMEVGIDIGDVDLVALVGAPPGTRALLQRIGRGGRRIGRTRLLALPRDQIERAALASMIRSARDGRLEPESYARRWSVFIQQSASFVAQQGVHGRRRRDLLDLAQEVWPEWQCSTAETIVDALVVGEHLREQRGRMVLGEDWAKRFETRGMHANIGSEAPGLPVVDASTGEEIARVSTASSGNQPLALGGQTWDVQNVVKGEILLAPRRGGAARESFRYAARRAPTGREYAVHVSRGLGFGADDAPILQRGDETLWFHFGGSPYEMLLRCLAGNLVGSLVGLALRGTPDLDAIRELASGSRLSDIVQSRYEEFEPLLGVGPYQRLLPSDARGKVVADLLDLKGFRRWLESRNVWHLAHEDSRHRLVETALRSR